MNTKFKLTTERTLHGNVVKMHSFIYKKKKRIACLNS